MDTTSTSSKDGSSVSSLPFVEAKNPGRPLHATLGHSQCHRSFWGSTKSLRESGQVSMGSTELKSLETQPSIPMGSPKRNRAKSEEKPFQSYSSRVNNRKDPQAQKKIKVIWEDEGQSKRRKPSGSDMHRWCPSTDINARKRHVSFIMHATDEKIIPRVLG